MTQRQSSIQVNSALKVGHQKSQKMIKEEDNTYILFCLQQQEYNSKESKRD